MLKRKVAIIVIAGSFSALALVSIISALCQRTGRADPQLENLTPLTGESNNTGIVLCVCSIMTIMSSLKRTIGVMKRNRHHAHLSSLVLYPSSQVASQVGY